jgi:cytochrome c oxidase cbb3-type subunit 3
MVPLLMSRIRSAALSGFLALAACDDAPSQTREWTPQDHDVPSNAGNPAGQVTARADPQEQGLVEIAWQKNCVTCHGPRGRGDGPQGPMFRAPDLTRGEWQGRVTDAEIADTIRKGRNKMPAFDLPPAVVDGLVKRIRAARGD